MSLLLGTGSSSTPNNYLIPLADSGWSVVYDGSAHSVDLPSMMVVDKASNVYIGGRSVGSATGTDMVVLKYSPQGEQLLELRYSSTGDPMTTWDEADAITVDEAGNLFVAGWSGSNDLRGAILIKYLPSGDTAWVRSFLSTNPFEDVLVSALCLDPAGNVYVGGSLGDRMLLLKYSPDGTLQRVGYFGDDTSSHTIVAIALFSNGEDVFVAGTRSRFPPDWDVPLTDCVIARFDTQFTVQWTKYLGREELGHYLEGGARQFALGSDGNLVVLVEGVAAKYSSTGELLWHTRAVEIPRGLALTENNSIITSGYDFSWTTGWDFSLTKFDTAGNVLWHSRYNSPDTARDFGGGVALDSEGNVYTTGSSSFAYSDYWSTTLKYDPQGRKLWGAEYDVHGTNHTEYIAVTDSGDVYVGGYCSDSTGWDFLVIKYPKSLITHVAEPKSGVSVTYSLEQNYPNPFNPTTTINYQLPIGNSQLTVLKVYDVLGREVATLVNEVEQPGEYQVEWDASGHPSGVYFYRLTAGSFTDVKKMVVVR